MKKFSFALDKVLKYKQQYENSLRNEHAAIMQQVSAQERKVRELEEEERATRIQMDGQKQSGCRVQDLNTYQGYLSYLNGEVAREKKHLAVLKRREETKRKELIAAKTETTSIDKLKEKKLEEYRKLESKEQEQLIEEFVNHELSIAR